MLLSRGPGCGQYVRLTYLGLGVSITQGMVSSDLMHRREQLSVKIRSGVSASDA